LHLNPESPRAAVAPDGWTRDDLRRCATMSELPPGKNAAPQRNSWARAFALVAIVAILVGAAVFMARELLHLPGKALGGTARILREGGQQLRSVAQAFSEGTIRTEFVSQAAELTGTSRFQFATLKQSESFKREESGTTAWGLIPLPKVVVQAVAPVEYTYFLDFEAPWEFVQEGNLVKVIAPPITPNTPALDVSALTFYTLEGSVWRDEQIVREKLRASLTAALATRARQNTRLVREVGRQRLTDFVQKWLAEKFSDGQQFQVKVIFPDERPTISPPPTL
jgi:hypothetical protein